MRDAMSEPGLPSRNPEADEPRPIQRPADGDANRSRRWPALEGTRAIAVLAVIGFHLGVLRGGYLGVDVFFVLSGFLITSLLIDEWDKRSGRIASATSMPGER